MDAKGARALVERLTREGRVYDDRETVPDAELALDGEGLPEQVPPAEAAPRHGAERAA